ncbi:50S ribosomal protein L11 methyltransferase, partial [bacterium]|nr:50S ribosomal protein L11 methyltransferase [bacterium]
SDESVKFKIYFPSSIHDPVDILESIEGYFKGITVNIKAESFTKKKIENWQTNWQKHFKPIDIGKNFLVRPPWESSIPGKKEIVINPGLGFGTGYHESTAIALELLEWLGNHLDFKEMIDVGTGSGILAIGATLMGVERITAIDIDEDALREVRSNFILSGLDGNMCKLMLSGPTQVNTSSDLVMANIEGHILLTLARDLLRLTRKKGHLILSGILAEQKQILAREFIREMTIIKELEKNEWYGVIWEKTK